jgi:nucleotide-binding universal stress UspA family protein
MKPIKNIVVATDFSVTSRNAYCYARALAQALDATLTIIHIQEQILVLSDAMATPLPSENDKEVVKNLEDFIADGDSMTSILTAKQELVIKIVAGDPVDVLINQSESEDTDLIVMGTTGLSDVLTKLFGSTSYKVSNKAHCPVILVPRDTKWEPIEQIVFASNYDSITSGFVQNITDFALSVHADIHFVNVRNFDPVLETRQKETSWKALSGIDPDLYFEKHTIYGNDTIEQLTKYNTENGIDMIAFVSKHRNFWENLAHKSIVENIALSTIIPIMVMHIDDN